MSDNASIDKHFPYRGTFDILNDGTAEYACNLNIADVANNCNKSYIMQLLHRNYETYVLFCRSGRVGQVGQLSTEVFIDKDLAVQMFKDVFRDKTGIRWDQRYDDDVEHGVSGKYQFILMKSDNKHTVNDAQKVQAQFTLSHKVVEFIKMISDPQLYSNAGKSYGFDTERLPLGSLGVKQIERAREILKELNGLMNTETGMIIDEKTELANELSSAFYSMIPSVQTKVKPLTSLKQLQEKGDLLELLRNMSYIAQDNSDVVKKYLDLDTTVTHLNDHERYELIRNYLTKNTGGSHMFLLKLIDIFEINKPREVQSYRKWSSLHNKQLLWHGTNMANAIGILSTGLRINPPGVPTTGKMFGNGLYFANASTKSAGYMGIRANGIGIMFLCEVALGNMYERVSAENIVTLPAGKHSTKGLGCYQPDPDTHVDIDGDVTVPIGRIVQTAVSGRSLLYDEFIIYDVSQIKMRYVVVVEYNSR